MKRGSPPKSHMAIKASGVGPETMDAPRRMSMPLGTDPIAGFAALLAGMTSGHVSVAEAERVGKLLLAQAKVTVELEVGQRMDGLEAKLAEILAALPVGTVSKDDGIRMMQ
jgi:hypothetical protein